MDGRAGRGLQTRYYFIDGCFRTAVDNNSSAFARERRGDREADPGGAGANQREFALQLKFNRIYISAKRCANIKQTILAGLQVAEDVEP